MSNDFVSNEVKKIVGNKDFQYPLNLAMASTWVFANFKGINLKIYDVQESSTLSDFFIIGTVANVTQARSVAETIERQLRKAGQKSTRVEGLDDAEWILLDACDIIVHIFLENIREIYDLDSLWAKYPQVKIPQEYYFPRDENKEQNLDDRGYF